jgi:hypothetical protein
MKSVILFSFISLVFFNVNAQKEKLAPIKLSGELIKKEWTKSTESYCAQGSEYYVLQVNNSSRTVIVEFEEEKIKVAKLLNKNVEVIGNHVEKTIPSGDGISQEPVSTYSTINNEETDKQTNKLFTCKVFKVNEVTLKK